MILLFVAITTYEKIGDGMRCENTTSSVITYTGSASCDGWKGISLEECKSKCTKNELPSSKCPRQGVECVYAGHSAWGCHLADATCKPINKDDSKYAYFKKKG